MRRLIPRFSLLTALLLTTIVAMAIVIAQFWQEVGPLRAEVRRWRNEYGVLTIDDDSKLHAIQLRELDDLGWKWRIWIPQGNEFKWVACYAYGVIPRDGFPKNPICIRPFAPGEYGEKTMTLTFQKSSTDATWRSRFKLGDGGSVSKIPDDECWIARPWSSTWQAVGSATVMAARNDEKFVIVRCRTCPASEDPSTIDMQESAPGFMIWLEQQWK